MGKIVEKFNLSAAEGLGQIPQHKNFVSSLSETIENAIFWIGARRAKRISKSVD